VEAVDVGAAADPVVAVQRRVPLALDHRPRHVGVGADRQQRVECAVQGERRAADVTGQRHLRHRPSCPGPLGVVGVGVAVGGAALAERDARLQRTVVRRVELLAVEPLGEVPVVAVVVLPGELRALVEPRPIIARKAASSPVATYSG
jgi:hypothetical protein